MADRVEKDSLGEVQVPADKYWAAQTQRCCRPIHHTLLIPLHLCVCFCPPVVVAVLPFLCLCFAFLCGKKGIFSKRSVLGLDLWPGGGVAWVDVCLCCEDMYVCACALFLCACACACRCVCTYVLVCMCMHVWVGGVFSLSLWGVHVNLNHFIECRTCAIDTSVVCKWGGISMCEHSTATYVLSTQDDKCWCPCLVCHINGCNGTGHRSLENFKIGDPTKEKMPIEVIRAMAILKKWVCLRFPLSLLSAFSPSLPAAFSLSLFLSLLLSFFLGCLRSISSPSKRPPDHSD